MNLIIKGCKFCPFFKAAEEMEMSSECNIEDTHNIPYRISTMPEDFKPLWCPLRHGSVTVQLEE